MKLGEFKKIVAELDGDDDLEVFVSPVMILSGGDEVTGFENDDFVTKPAQSEIAKLMCLMFPRSYVEMLEKEISLSDYSV